MIILGIDVGTNSAGWSLIQQDLENKKGRIIGMGTRIIPMSKDIIGDFNNGNSISQTAERTRLRGVRRLKERHLLRRERLHRVLHIMDFLPQHYAEKIDFEKRVGQFLPETETKFAYDAQGQFIFKKSFEEMLADFRQYQPALVADGKKVPYDWTIYYLRKKALTQKIGHEELAWLLLHFNQKRGYYQLRGEESEEKPNRLEEFYSLKINDVTADEPQKGKTEIWYNIVLENGWIYRRASKLPLFDWANKVRDFIVTTELNEDGTIKKDKDGKEKRSFRSPKEDDWQLLKKKTEADISKSQKTVGAFIYDTLLEKPGQKIKGKLVRTIERHFYKDELKLILQKQIELNKVLTNKELFQQCIEELYPHNLHHQSALAGKDFLHLFIEDILYYQRPLRSQKSTISECPLEYRTYIKDGLKKTESLKCIPKSHPLFQEFRLWQWISNLRIYEKATDKDETARYLPTPEERADLFTFLDNRKEINQKNLLRHFKLKESTHRWNYAEDKKYPCNETYTMIAIRLEKMKDVPAGFLTKEKQEGLWHIIYSVTDKIDYEKALKSFAIKNGLDVNSFFEAFRRFPPFPGTYGSYSAKAIKKLLPLMRTGKYWDITATDNKTKDRISKIIDAVYDDNIRERVREKAIHLTETDHFQGLPEWLAKYIVYDRHAERGETGKWRTVADLEAYLRQFRQHSLKNPIVEQVLTETLRMIKDIWTHYGNGAENFFDEIHIELGREMKNPADERKRLSDQITKNENTNLRIKALLMEMMNDAEVENVRPYSPMQQEILKVYEDGVLNNDIEIPEDISKISRMAVPSGSELQRYKLWLEQKYCSPYTGRIIPLNKLFTPAYEIEHIIPQSRYFDDSFSNKIICETAVNKLKDNQTGLEFIQKHGGQVIELGFGQTVQISKEQDYTAFVQRHYARSHTKRNKLLALDIPEKMIERQLNDTRYISRFMMQLLSNIVRQEKNDDGVNAKKIFASNGQITAKLRQDWGLDAIWNELILPRFERMNRITGSEHFTVFNERHQKMLPSIPLELQKGFQKKRIDHRHHAMDALVIACATRNHINFLNNQNALNKKRSKDEKQKDRYDLKVLLCDKKYNQGIAGSYNWVFKQPWENFAQDARQSLEQIIVSFKQNLRVINKTANHYELLKDGKKIKVKQDKGLNWAIRKSLHKDTASGLVSLQQTRQVALSAALDDAEHIADKSFRKYVQNMLAQGYDKKKLLTHFKEKNNQWEGQSVARVNIYFWDKDNVASRTDLDSSFTEARIKSITDTGIQKILLRHLSNKSGKAELAFSPEGIEEMNKNIAALNNGKFHQPILKVRTYETKGNKFKVGQSGNKIHKYVEAAKGTNLFFAIYLDENGKRSFETVPLNIVAERQKQGLGPVPEINEKEARLLFHLSPNDLVYIPSDDEIVTNSFSDTSSLSLSQIYKIVSFTGNRLYGIHHHIAFPIVDGVEFSQLNKMETTIDKKSLKDFCYKIQLNRIGNVKSLLK